MAVGERSSHRTRAIRLAALCVVVGVAGTALAAEGGVSPHGCVSCHAIRKDLGADFRLSKTLREWHAHGSPPDVVALAQRAAPPGVKLVGRHPDVAALVAREPIPTACINCHRANQARAPYFGRLLHLLKYVRTRPGRGNHFLVVYHGWCTHCHALDARTGVWGLKVGREGEGGGG